MILKKMLKAALAASLVLGMSSIGMAADGLNISGRVQAHWGQYTSGADGYKAWFKNTTQGHLNMRAASGPMKYFLQLEMEDDGNTSNTSPAGNNVNNMQGNATYTAGDLSVTIGTAVNWRSCGYTQDAGMGNTKSGETWVMCDTYKEQDGIDIDYKIAALKGGASLTIFNTATMNIMSVGAEVRPIDMLSVYVRQNSETPTNALDGETGDTTAKLMIGLKAMFGNMWAAVDQSTVTIPKVDPATDDTVATRLGLQFGMKGIGPGTIVVTSGMKNVSAGDTLSTEAVTNAVFQIPVAKGAVARVFYTSNGRTPYTLGEAGDTTTASYMGFGLQLTM